MQFLTTIKTKLAGVYLLYFTLKKTTGKNTFNNFYKNAGSLLVIFPSAKEYIKEAAVMLKNLAEEKTNITAVIDKRFEQEVAQVKNLSVISYTEKDKNFLGLAARQFKNKLSGKKYDLIIDLNLSADYYSLDCINSANPGVRVGFYESRTAKLFHVQIKNSSKESKISYKNLLNCLTMF